MTEKRAMKIGCCAPIEQYGQAVDAGFSYIELPGSVLSEISDEELGQWERTVGNGSIPCRGLNASIPPAVRICGPGFSEDAAEQYARRLCTRAARLGALNIGIGSPNSRTLPQGFSVETAWRQTEQFLRIFCAAALPCGIRVLWEPVNPSETNFGVDSLESLAHVEKLLGEGLSNFGMIADLYHMACKGEDVEVLARMLPYVEHIHIASSLSGRGHVTEADAELMKPMLRLCAGRVESMSVEASRGSIGGEGAAALVLLRRWLEEMSA